MQPTSNSTGFLKSTQAKVLTGVLIAQALLFYGLSRAEGKAVNTPLSQLSRHLGKWTMSGDEGYVDQETRDVLKADEILTRSYQSSATPIPANLFVAYFRTQRTGQAPHSPKNCLPGNGWSESESGHITVDIPGRATPIEINRYLVAKGENKSIVLYWYQSRDRVVASEYRAKMYTAVDAMRYNRTDTALVRVVVPVPNGDSKAATDAAIDFVKDFLNPLRQHFPA
jgi:EpsI family protein